MGRRRKQVEKIVRRRLPELYVCPKCGKNTVKATINKKREVAIVICSSCGLNSSFPVTPQMSSVDAYCKFTDRYYGEPSKEEPIVGG